MATESAQQQQQSYSSLAFGALSRFASPAYQPAVYLAKQACLSLLSRLNSVEARGVLEIIEEDGKRSTLYGDPASKHAVQQRRRKAGVNETNHDQQSDKSFTHAVLNVTNDVFWIRLALGSDLGFAEAYMLGDVETPELGDCFALFIENRQVLSDFNVGVLSRISSYVQSALNKRYANTKSGSLRNIGAHYDISNRMYEAFLSRDMTYSCAVFPTLDADVCSAASPLLRQSVHGALTNKGGAVGNSNASRLRYESSAAKTLSPPHAPAGQNGELTPPESVMADGVQSPNLVAALSSTTEDELEDAQYRKIRLVLERAALQSHHRLLEIGTGWGALAMEAVRSSGCMVDSLTLSVEQKALAEQRIAQAGLSHKINVHLMDYRDMPHDWTGRFDRVVSVEMLEAVGIEFLGTYFTHVDRVLNPTTGICVAQCITMPEERFEAYISQVDFIQKWIFPGGVLPSVTSLVEACTRGAKGRLIIDTVHSIGPHYARTLREWRTRFLRTFDTRIAPALLDDHADIRRLPKHEQARQVQVFKRKWLYYFIYCEVGFTQRVIGDHILSFSRSGNFSLPVCCA